MPGRKWYVVALGVFLLGLAIMGAFLFLRLRALDERIQQVVVPGSAELGLEEPGRYTIYHETGATIDGTYYDDSDLTGLEVLVLAPSGDAVTLESAGVNETYSLGGREGTAIFRFDAPEAGVYRIEAAYPPGRTGGEGVLAVGKGFVKTLLITVFGALAIAGLGALIAIAVAAVTFVKRYRAKRPATG